MLQSKSQTVDGDCGREPEAKVRRIRMGDWLVIVAQNVVALKRVDRELEPMVPQHSLLPPSARLIGGELMGEAFEFPSMATAARC